jgi:hypothetical protein
VPKILFARFFSAVKAFVGVETNFINLKFIDLRNFFTYVSPRSKPVSSFDLGSRFANRTGGYAVK